MNHPAASACSKHNSHLFKMMTTMQTTVALVLLALPASLAATLGPATWKMGASYEGGALVFQQQPRRLALPPRARVSLGALRR
jgi:hypothetical protein